MKLMHDDMARWLFLKESSVYAECMNGFGVQSQSWYLSSWFIAVMVVFFAAICVAGVLAYRAGKRRGLLEAQLAERDRMDLARKDAVERSRSALSGQVSEQIAPWLPDFPTSPADARFIGKPVDFVSFCGADEGMVREIVFIEVKTGRSSLSTVERSVRDAIVQGHVRWVEYRIE
ncbi:Holliday junction resolvase-like protein (modular protein) [uncultured spirochete]|uniref:Holliday junction resolvase-like protein (Modular protein) n=1 Tax=uncultured spirochete TaxID=156406 RepID=A0A3P3XPD4_9SPIR|nr:Holliday junction resolvase-like protein (modular protein) [uncultured spirochete]